MPTIVRNSFYQGIKSSLDPTIIPENSIWRGYNVRSDLSGVLRIREGTEALFPSLGGGKVQGMTVAFDEIYFIWNRKLHRYDQDSDTAILVSNTILTANFTDNVTLLNWTRSGEEVLYIFGGSGIYQYDETTLIKITPYVPAAGEDANMLSNTTGPQNCELATLRASLSQRVAVAGFPSSPNTVYLSAPLDITYFPSTQILQLPDDGGVITGITNWYNSLIIFRDKDIWAFFGTDLTDSSASLVLQDSSVGCIAPKTITHVPELGICFVGPDNIYTLQGVSGVENQSKAVSIGDDVVNLIQKSIKDGEVEEAAGTYYNREYRVCFPESINTERVFRLNLQNNRSWYIDAGPLSNNYVVWDKDLYGSFPSEGLLQHITLDTLFDEYQSQTPPMFGNTFNGKLFNEAQPSQLYTELTGIPFSVTFRRENLQPGPARIKRIFLYVMALGTKETQVISHFGNSFNDGLFGSTRHETVTVDTTTEQNFDISIFVDGNEFVIDDLKIHAKKMNHSSVSSSEPVRIYEARIRPSLKGHFAQIKVEAKSPGQIIALLGYGIDYQQKGRIRGIRQGVTNNKDW